MGQASAVSGGDGTARGGRRFPARGAPATGRRLPPGARARPAQVPARRAPGGTRLEFAVLPGLAEVALAELAEHPLARAVRAVPGREDAVQASWTGPLSATQGLRTVVAPFLLVPFDVPRPRSLLDGQHFPRLLAAVRTAREVGPRPAPGTFRFDAAGSDSATFRLLAAQLAAAAHLRHDPEDGALLLRVRRGSGERGWDVLVRLGARPLSARPWRRAGHPAAANATVAAAMSRLARPRPDERVLNLMCGSGTLLVERLLAAPAGAAVGVDSSAEALAAAGENLAAAGLAGRVRLVRADVADEGWAADGPFDLLLADPPWGDKAGHHRDAERVHRLLLERAAQVAAPGARLVLLTHEIRVVHRCLDAVADRWRLESELSVFHKGHHPRIYLLHRVPGHCTTA